MGPLDPDLGWLVDYHEIARCMEPVLKQLDHKVLNDVPGLENPTSELLAKWLYEKVVTEIPLLKSVSVMETSTTECTYPVR